jgi:hypothetical protein
MCSYRLPLALFIATSLSLTAAPEGTPPAKKSSWGVWHSIVDGVKSTVDGAGAVVKTASGAVGKVFDFSSPSSPSTPKRKGLRLELLSASNPVRLSQGGFLAVKLQLFNTGKKTALLEFESGQRAAVVLRDVSGKIVARALNSAGQEAGLVTLNSGERIEFVLQLPTKELAPDKTYTLEAALTGQAGLVARLPLRVSR